MYHDIADCKEFLSFILLSQCLYPVATVSTCTVGMNVHSYVRNSSLWRRLRLIRSRKDIRVDVWNTLMQVTLLKH